MNKAAGTIVQHFVIFVFLIQQSKKIVRDVDVHLTVMDCRQM